MARQHKQGLDYFPHDCHFDDQLEYIIALHKEIGYYSYFRLLEKIYSGHGYYTEADEKSLILISNKINVDILDLNDIINNCLCEHLFDENLFNDYEILTSSGIQVRFFEAIKRRKSVDIINEYILIDNVDILLQNVSINRLNVCKSTQSKVKKSKVKKRRIADEKSANAEYKKFVDKWFKFFKYKTGNEPSFNSIDGKSLKSIIGKLEKLIKDNDSSEGTIELFHAILSKWESLDSWHQENCLELKVFNQKFDTIFAKLKTVTNGQDELFAEIVAKHSR